MTAEATRGLHAAKEALSKLYVLVHINTDYKAILVHG